jgi:HEAT repeat protein
MRSISIVLLACLLVVTAAAPGDAQDKEKDIVKDGSRIIEVAGKTLDQWIKELQDSDPSAQETAIRAISNFGEEGRRAAPAIIPFLRDKDVSLRVNAVITLGAIGLDNRDVINGVGGLQALLRDTQGIVRYQAAMTLGRLGPQAKSALSYLMTVTILDRTSWEIRKAAAYAVGAIGAGDKMNFSDSRAVVALKTALNDPCAQVRLEAILGLSTLGQYIDPQEIPNLKPLLERRALIDRDKTVMIYSRLLLMQYDATYIRETNLVPIAQQLQNPDVQVRLQAARALAMLADKAKSRIPDLIEALKDKESLVASAATAALVAMKNEMTDQQTIDIGKILLYGEKHYVRCHAAQALGSLGERAKFRVPELIRALQDQNSDVVKTSAMALIEMGDAARPAIPYLKELRNHKDEDVQDAAELAIYGIENPQAVRPKPEKK